MSGKKNEIALLQSIGHAGAASSGQALTALLKKRVDASSPEIQIVPLKAIDSLFKKGDSLTGVFVPLSGKVNGTMAVLFSRKDALLMIDALTGEKKGTTKFVGEYNQSVMREVGNILCNSYVNALAAMFRMSISAGVPQLVFNLSQPTASVLGESASAASEVVLIETVFQVSDISAQGRIIFFFDEKSFDFLLERI